MTDAIVLVFLTKIIFDLIQGRWKRWLHWFNVLVHITFFCDAKFKIKNEHISINLHIHVVNKSQLNNAELLDKPKQKANKAMYFNFYQRPVKYLCITSIFVHNINFKHVVSPFQRIKRIYLI